MLMVTDGKAKKSTRKQRKKEAQWSFVCREKVTALEVGTPMPSSLCLTKAVSYSYWVAPPCDSPSCLWVLKLLVTSDLLLPFAGSWCSQEPFIKGFSQGLDPPHKSAQIFLTCITVKTHHCLRNQTSEYSVFPPLPNQVLSSSLLVSAVISINRVLLRPVCLCFQHTRKCTWSEGDSNCRGFCNLCSPWVPQPQRA